MHYDNAKNVLPPALLEQLWQYTDGTYLYIPRKPENRLSWGERTNGRQETAARNRQILAAREAGASIGELAARFFLSEKSISRILREQKRLSQRDEDR